MTDRPEGLLAELRQRRAVQFVLGYLVGAWVAAQVVGFFVEQGYVSRLLLDVALYVLVVGFFVTLVLVWYHGEEGRQGIARTELALLGALALVGLGGSAWMVAQSLRADQPAFDSVAVVELGDSSVAVLPFQNDLADESMAWLDRGVSDLLATDLAQLPWLRVVSGQRLVDLLDQMGEGQSGVVPEGLQASLTRLAGARYMLTGRLGGAGDEIVLIASLQDATTGEIRAAARHQGTDVFDLVDLISSDLLREGLIMGGDTELAPVAELTTRSLDAFARYRSGQDARARFLLDEAEEHFQAAIDLDPSFALAYFQLASVQATTGSFDVAMRNLAQAQEHLTTASEHDRLFVEGLSRLIRGDVGAGMARLNELIAKYPDEKEARVVLANFHQGIGQEDEAERLMRETLLLDPSYALAYNLLAYGLARRSQYDSALVMIDRYAELEPGQPNPFDSRGEILEQAGRHAEAREAYRSALELRGDFTTALRHLARSYMREERAGEARQELARYAELPSPNTRIVAQQLIGDAHFFDGRFDEGYAAYDRALAEAEAADRPGSQQNVLRALMFNAVQLGHLERAEAVGEALARIAPDPMIVTVRAIVHGERGERDQVTELADRFEVDYRNDPEVAPFFGLVSSMYRAYDAFYRGEFPRVVELARGASLSVPGAGTDYLGFPVMRALLALERTEAALLQPEISRGAGVAGFPGQFEPVEERLLTYYQGRAAELAGDTATAVEAYARLAGAWGDAVQEVPAVRDVRERLTELSGR